MVTDIQKQIKAIKKVGKEICKSKAKSRAFLRKLGIDKYQDAWDLYYEELNKDTCKNCDRKITENMITKNGCVWCDAVYHKSKKVIALKKLQEIKNG